MGAVQSRSTKIYKQTLRAGVALSALALVLGTSGAANAQSADQLQSQIDQLQRQVNQLKKQQTQQAQQVQEAVATRAAMPVKGPKGVCAPWEIKPGKTLTMCTPGGEVTFYGNMDVSFDYASKNVGSLKLNGATPPRGNFGWMPDISTNLSYFGVRGFQHLYDPKINFVYQLEAGFDISATPGNRQSNANLSDGVNGALFSRNSYIGIASSEYGAIKIGKTDAPYKSSTTAFNPFSGEIGDYAVVMGNTGGDNRVEFGTRLSHAIWYESPNVSGFQFNALFAPGQNRSDNSDNLASAESDCTGGNDPTSGNPLQNGVQTPACTDGSFSNAASANLSYTNGGFYATAAGEWHQKVNRSNDIAGIFGSGPGDPLFDQDVADEAAAKIGALYNFKSTGTTIGGIFEWMHRYVPADLDFQNERTRNGTWLFASQQITNADSVHFGWAHAFRTPGDPGQHNDLTVSVTNPFTGVTSTVATNQNQADMVTGAYKHKLSDNLTWYTAVAATFNGPSAHYDLGAGGHVTTDCHDASLPANGGFGGAGGNCFTGTTILGVSTGMQYRF